MNRQERLEAVYQYLRNTGRVHTQKEFAEKVGYTETSLSKAFNGIMSSLTDNLFKAIVRTYRPIFSLEWLLTGDGSMLTLDDTQQKKPLTSDNDDENINAIMQMYKNATEEKAKAAELFKAATKEKEETESLKTEIATLRNELRAARNSMLEASAEFTSATKKLNAVISLLSDFNSFGGQMAAEQLERPKEPISTAQNQK